MKKSQRARLSVLLAKDQAALSADEKTELATLQTLATQNPDASKDVDDTPRATLASVIGTIVSSVKGKVTIASELTAAQQALAVATQERDTARTALATAESQVATSTAQLAEFGSFFGITAAELGAKPASDVRALIAAKVSALSADQIAAMGIPPKELPAQSTATGGNTFAEKVAEFNAMKPGPERDAFYAKHIAPEFSKN